MKILIVDDYPGVVNGIMQGIEWNALSVSKVLTAQNAMEAKEIIQTENPNIILCDIEMPKENGLQLFAWLRKEKYKTCCIFLTSHAEFHYAQEAIKLGAFDYIVQPAPYEEIQKVLERAIASIQIDVEKEEVYDMGMALNKQITAIAAGVQRDFLSGAPSYREISTMMEYGHFPKKEIPCVLVLLQIVRWTSCAEEWEGPFLAQALSNIIAEIFTPPLKHSVVACLEEDIFSLILYSEEANELEQDILTQQLLYLNNVCQQYLHCFLASYISGQVLCEKLPSTWQKLALQKEENVTLQSGIFTLQQQQNQGHAYHIPKIQHWGKLLKEGYPEAAEEAAFFLLDEMVEKNSMNLKTLRHFYQDYIQMLYTTDGVGVLNRLFKNEEALELYRNGMKTVSHMKKLIRYVSLHYTTPLQEEDQKTLVQKAIDYIDENLESELRRDDVAANIFLNADYLTRIFKKETGMTLKEYITRQKMRQAQSLLRTTSLPVGFIAAKLGYSNFSHFSSTYKKIFGVTPQEERQQLAAQENEGYKVSGGI